MQAKCSTLKIALRALAAVVIFYGHLVGATNPLLNFKHYGTREGLPSSQIYQVLQDHQGYLWFASDHGVCRFNGYEFKVFSSASGLKDNTVFKLQEDYKHRVWMQTFSGGLYYYENDSIKAYQYNNKIIDCVRRKIPMSFYLNKEEGIYFTVSGDGAYRIDNLGKLNRIFEIEIPRQLNQIFIRENSNNTFLTLNSNWVFPRPKTEIILQTADAGIDTFLTVENYFGPISGSRLKNGKLLIAMENSIYLVQNHHLILQYTSSKSINSIYESIDGDIWVSTYDKLIRFRGGQFNVPEFHLTNEFVTGTIFDHENGLWISTLYNGVYYLRNSNIVTLTDDEFIADKPLCLAASSKNIYVGFQSGRVAIGGVNGLKNLDCLTVTEHISSLWFDDSKNELYIGRNIPGVIRNNSFVKFNPSETTTLKGEFERTASGLLLSQTINNLFKIENNSLSKYLTFTERSNCLFRTSSNAILAGTNNGVFILDEKTPSLNPFHPEIFSGIRVDDIGEFNGHLFFLTHGVGLLQLYNGKLKKYTTNDGMPSDVLHNITVSKNNIWISSNNGIAKLTPKGDNYSYHISNIAIDEGMPDNETNSLLIRNDTVWVICGNNVVFFPENAEFVNIVEPKVKLTAVYVNGKSVLLDNSLKLSSESNNVSVAFEAISFKSISGIVYKYVLIHNSDSVVALTNDRRVEFLSLRPGYYLLKVFAMNSSGVWSGEPMKLEFVIKPPFWNTWWFLLTSIFIIVLVSWRLINRRIRRVRNEEQKKSVLEKQILSLEMKALRAQMNPHFIFNVMNSIQDYILKNDSYSAQKYLTKFARLVRLILNNSSENEVLLTDELLASELYVELEQQRFEGKFTFVEEIASGLRNSSIVIPSMLFQPYLENAIKHGISHKEGESILKLSVFEEGDIIRVVIEDDGVGRALSQSWNSNYSKDHISFGTSITASRMEAYNSSFQSNIKIDIIDLFHSVGNSSGTRVEMIIPIRYRT